MGRRRQTNRSQDLQLSSYKWDLALFGLPEDLKGKLCRKASIVGFERKWNPANIFDPISWQSPIDAQLGLFSLYSNGFQGFGGSGPLTAHVKV